MPAEKRPPSRRRYWVFTWLFLIVLAGGYTAFDLCVKYPRSAGPGVGQILEVEIPRGVGPESISNLLHEKGLVDSPGRFRLWLRISGGMPGIRAGRFRLKDNMTPRQIVETLQGSGLEKGVRITVPEGFRLSEIADLLEREELVSVDAFLAAATDGDLLMELKIPGSSAEGFLFPETYYFDKDVKPKDIVRKMHRQFRAKMGALKAGDDRTLLEIVTLASIVQAEAQVLSEAPKIAGVYTNRLDPKVFPSGLMQADPTVAYGCDPLVSPRAPSCVTFRGRLGRRQLDDSANPYNTYRHPGLPPGPICAPGLEALEAAIDPPKVPYIFFVAGPGGTHRFSTTLKEHNEAVKLYRASKSSD